jgi:peroxiredoxin
VAKAALLGSVTPFLLKTADNPGGVDRSVFDGMIEGVKKDRIAFLDQFFPAFYNDAPDKRIGADVIPFTMWIAGAASPRGTAACNPAFGTTDFRADLKKFSTPPRDAHGDADQIVPFDISGKLAHEQIAGSRLEVIKGAPHGFAATHAQRTSELLLDFLGS